VIGSLLLASALGLLALPAGATASQTTFPFRLPAGTPAKFRALLSSRMAPAHGQPSFHPGFALKAHDGYRIGVVGFGTAVALEVVRGHASSVTAYVARGTVTPNRIEASFGELGRVAVRFRPSKHRTWVKPHRVCHGKERVVVRRGVYVGVIRFKGENGYVSVRAHRAKGQVRSIAPQCRRRKGARRVLRAVHPSQQGPFWEEITVLGASWRHAIDSAAFAVITLASHAEFLAVAEQSEGGLAIVRFAVASGSSKALTINDPLTLARVSPPKPFRGTGTYRAAPDGTTTWTGSLAVSFPGAPSYPLAGPPFEAELAAGF
jgi:hypothetical protein